MGSFFFSFFLPLFLIHSSTLASSILHALLCGRRLDLPFTITSTYSTGSTYYGLLLVVRILRIPSLLRAALSLSSEENSRSGCLCFRLHHRLVRFVRHSSRIVRTTSPLSLPLATVIVMTVIAFVTIILIAIVILVCSIGPIHSHSVIPLSGNGGGVSPTILVVIVAPPAALIALASLCFAWRC